MINGSLKMHQVVSANPRFLLVLEYFNISLGFGDQTVQEICQNHKVNEQLFLTIANLYCHRESVRIDARCFDHSDALLVLEYLKTSHVYFLDEKIPQLKRIIEEKSARNPEEKYTKIINKFVHDYAEEVFDHINYENTIVFPYVKSLLEEHGKKQIYTIEEFKKNHSNIEEKLTDLKNLLIKYVPPEYDAMVRRKLLFELYDLEWDIEVHDFIENNLLIPIAQKLEN
jgi:regulator of cell morphogenesis and NO signaling